MPLWAADDDDLNDVDPNLAIGNYGQNLYDGGIKPLLRAGKTT